LLAAENTRGGDLTTGSGDWQWTSPGQEGLSSAFWKQDQNLTAWTAPYTTTSLFNTVFGVTQESGLTLLAALQRSGTGTNALARQAVAALLNAAHPDINYVYTEAQVIALVKAAYANPSIVDSTAALLEAENERGGHIALGTGRGGGGNPFGAGVEGLIQTN